MAPDGNARCVGKKMKERSTEPEKDEAMSQRELPEEIVEAVIAKLPFPNLFKARVLSKCWYFKFPSPSPLLSCETSSFQGQVCANLASWRNYAPVFINWTSGLLLAFDGTTSQWVGPLPQNIWQNQWTGIPNIRQSQWADWRPPVSLAGALVLLDGRETLSVGNVVTGSCRHLNLPPNLGLWSRPFPGSAGQPLLRLVAVGSLSYKVIAVYYVVHAENVGNDINALCVHLYDSNSQVWTSTLTKYSDDQALTSLDYFLENCAYMDGKVYFLAQGKVRESLRERLKLVSYDLEDSAWKIMVKGFSEFQHPFRNSGVFRCGEKVIVVVVSESALSIADERTFEDYIQDAIRQSAEHGEGVEVFSTWTFEEKSIQVFQLDMQSLELVLLSNGSPEISVRLGMYKFGAFPNPELSANANFLYFGWDRLPSSVAKFDLNSREWSSIPLASSAPDFDWKRHQLDWIHGAFEPGINPFVSA